MLGTFLILLLEKARKDYLELLFHLFPKYNLGQPQLELSNLISIEQCLTEIRKLLEDVPIQNIWNLDETALQHRTTSSRSYVTINSDGRGVKRSKERITVTLIVSASGEKLIPQVIGKSKQPCVLRGIDIGKKYQVKYDFQSKA